VSKNSDSWRKAPLAAVCAKVTDGTHHSPPNERVGAFKYVTAKNIRPWGLDLTDITYVTEQVHNEVFSRCPPEFEDVLYIKDGVTTGLAAVNTLREPFSMLSSVALLKPHRELLSPYFLKHWLNSPDTVRAITGEMTGTAIRRVVLRHLRGVEIPLPPLNEQKRMVAKIDALQARSDAAKEALDAIPPLLEKFRQSVLAAAFRGDLTKKWREAHPEVEPASKLLERIRAERRRRWEAANPKKKYVEPAPVDPSGLPALPEGWCWVTVQECAVVAGGKRLPSGHGYVEAGSPHPYIRVSDFKDGGVDTTDLRYISAKTHNEIRRYVIRTDDCYISIAGTIGVVGTIPPCLDGANLTENAARISPCRMVTPSYLAAALRTEHARHQILDKTIATTLSKLALFRIESIRIPVPPLAEQTAICEAIEGKKSLADAMKAALNESRSRLPALDQSILAKAFRGELVPQDPSDEPASALLERIREAREESEATSPSRRRKGAGSR
jgi:type I restriction enzyme S subunit